MIAKPKVIIILIGLGENIKNTNARISMIYLKIKNNLKMLVKRRVKVTLTGLDEVIKGHQKQLGNLIIYY